MRGQDVREAVRLGADFLGFVFAPGGPRSLTPETARRMLRGLDTGQAQRVGVFRDQPARFVNEVVEKCGLDLVQLHGDEPRDYPSALAVPALRVVHVPVLEAAVPAGATKRASGARVARGAETSGIVADGAASEASGSNGGTSRVGHQVPLAPNVFAVLVDAQDEKGLRGGLGRRIDPEALENVLRSLPAGTRVIVAGGLTPENVGEVVERHRPFAVDVASGIESAPGVKDAERMAAFMAALGRTTAKTSGRNSARGSARKGAKGNATKGVKRNAKKGAKTSARVIAKKSPRNSTRKGASRIGRKATKKVARKGGRKA
jgi:phosphoribosylanthranilate isomerase